MNKQRLINEVFQGLVTVAIIAAMTELALAQAATDLATDSTNLITQTGSVAPIISTLFWVGGAAMMGIGALKLKEHAEDPNRAPLRGGIARMAVGAALLTIPFFAQFVVSTLGAGSAGVVYTAFTTPGGAAP